MARQEQDKLKAKVNKLEQGLNLLDQWITQLLDQGIDVLSKDVTRIEDISTRLTDFGMPSISKRLRLLPEKIKNEKHWKETVLQELGELLLYIEIFKKAEVNQREELIRYLGTPMRKADVESLNLSEVDSWIYVGSKKIKEENIVAVRSWFIGISSGKTALYLEYIFNRFTTERKFEFGKSYIGKLFYYSSQLQQRVTQIPTTTKLLPLGYIPKASSISEFLMQWSTELNTVPWLKSKLIIVQNFEILKKEECYYLHDHSGQLLLLNLDEENIPQLQSLSLDSSAILIAEYEEGRVNPLSVFHSTGILGLN